MSGRTLLHSVAQDSSFTNADFIDSPIRSSSRSSSREALAEDAHTPPGTPFGPRAQQFVKHRAGSLLNLFLLDDLTAGPLVLCYLASKGKLVELKSLLSDESKKLDVNLGDYDERTPLHLAAEEGHLEVVHLLVESGADVNVCDRFGGTPLRGALKNNHSLIANYLKDHGAKLLIENKKLQNSDLPTDQASIDKYEQIRHIFDEIEKDKVPNRKDFISVAALEKRLNEVGLFLNRHPLLKQQVKTLANGVADIPWKNFFDMMLGDETILVKALFNKLAIPNWKRFCETLTTIFEQVKDNKGGAVATYIPELGCADPDWFGISVVSVDGQYFSLGDSGIEYPIESCMKPILYSMAIEDHGYDYVHKYVGKEPSGRIFNAFTLNDDNLPHNACINAGAIAVSGLFHKEDPNSARFKEFTRRLSDLGGGMKVGFNQTVYLSEKETGNRNHALAYFMASHPEGFPSVNIENALDYYFQLCSVDVNTDLMAYVASTYANYGVCPTTGAKCLSFENVKRTLQLMFSCGMYDYSGEWACTVGLPSKSGVSGEIFLVVPDSLGVCIYSPPLDKHGNSERGRDFATRLAAEFGWNIFDILFQQYDKKLL